MILCAERFARALPASLALEFPVRRRTARHSHPRVPSQLTLFANRQGRRLMRRPRPTASWGRR